MHALYLLLDKTSSEIKCVLYLQMSLDGFRIKTFNLVIATDVPGRGIDIPVRI